VQGIWSAKKPDGFLRGVAKEVARIGPLAAKLLGPSSTRSIPAVAIRKKSSWSVVKTRRSQRPPPAVCQRRRGGLDLRGFRGLGYLVAEAVERRGRVLAAFKVSLYVRMEWVQVVIGVDAEDTRMPLAEVDCGCD
jgi:hypothetical protein